MKHGFCFCLCVRERKSSRKLIGVCVFNASGYSRALNVKDRSREMKTKRRKISRRGSALNKKVGERSPVRVEAVNNALLLIPHASPAIISRAKTKQMCFFFFTTADQITSFVIFGPRVVSLFCQIKFHGEGLHRAPASNGP